MVAFTTRKNKKKSLPTKKLSFFLHRIVFCESSQREINIVVAIMNIKTIKQLKEDNFKFKTVHAFIGCGFCHDLLLG